MSEENATKWEPIEEEPDASEEVTMDMADDKQDKTERKTPAKKAKDDKPAEKAKKTTAAQKRPERKSVWVCKECGMSWNRPRLSCNVCGGPTGRFHGTPEELAAYAQRIQTRRRKGIINS